GGVDRGALGRAGNHRDARRCPRGVGQGEGGRDGGGVAAQVHCGGGHRVAASKRGGREVGRGQAVAVRGDWDGVGAAGDGAAGAVAGGRDGEPDRDALHQVAGGVLDIDGQGQGEGRVDAGRLGGAAAGIDGTGVGEIIVLDGGGGRADGQRRHVVQQYRHT